MARKPINISTPNDGLGDALRKAFDYVNQMFIELYNSVVFKVSGKDLSDNNLTDELVEKINSIEDLAQQNVQSDWTQDDDTQTDFIKNKPPELLAAVGYFDYDDLATQTTPISILGGGADVLLTNDALGDYTNIDQAPYGVTRLWDPITNSFDFSELSIGDTVDIRLDLTLTTTSLNTQVSVDLTLGDAFPFTTPFITPTNYKNVVTDSEIIRFNGIYIGSEDVQLGGGQFFARADKNCSLKVKGWYCRVIRKGVNIIDISDKTKLSEFINDGNGSVGDAFLNLNTAQVVAALKTFKNEIKLDGTDFDNVKITDHVGREMLRYDTQDNLMYLKDGNVSIEGSLMKLPNSTVSTVLNGGDKTLVTLEVLNSKISQTGIISVTYSQLTTLIASNGLIKGQVYLLTDYMTTYTQPVTLASKSSGVIEPLYLTATDVNTLSNIAYSQLYPQDIVYYEVTGILDGDEYYNVGTEGFTKGKIYRRIDIQKNNDIGTDWRHVKYDRSGIDKLLFEDYTYCFNNIITERRLLNTVFNGDNNFEQNNIEGAFLNNTISGNFINNHIKTTFNDNTIGSDDFVTLFMNNVIIGEFFKNNNITDDFVNNRFNHKCNLVEFYDIFTGNIIGSFQQNNIAYPFVDNNIKRLLSYTTSIPISYNQFTVSTLPTGVSTGQEFIVTDALNPSFNEPLVGGGTTICPVFYNGTEWVATVGNGSEGIRVDMTNNIIDYALGDTFTHPTLTENTTFTDLNLPQGNRTKTITMHINLATFSATFPAYYEYMGGVPIDNEINIIVFECINGNSGSELVRFFINPKTV